MLTTTILADPVRWPALTALAQDFHFRGMQWPEPCWLAPQPDVRPYFERPRELRLGRQAREEMWAG
jgi:hypothetical protein